MVGKKCGPVKLLESDAITSGNLRMMKYHSIIHQKIICVKALKMYTIMQIVKKAVNFIRAKGLNHLQFYEYIIIYFTEA